MMKVLKKKRKGGFTLIELIVVIAILGILAAIAVPRFAGIQGNAATRANQANIRTIESAITLYMANTSSTGTYDAVTLSNAGAIGGVGIVAGNLVTDGYLNAMPIQPDGAGSYVKAAGGNVVAE